jgi:hypothetical protein
MRACRTRCIRRQNGHQASDYHGADAVEWQRALAEMARVAADHASPQAALDVRWRGTLTTPHSMVSIKRASWMVPVTSTMQAGLSPAEIGAPAHLRALRTPAARGFDESMF